MTGELVRLWVPKCRSISRPWSLWRHRKVYKSTLKCQYIFSFTRVHINFKKRARLQLNLLFQWQIAAVNYPIARMNYHNNNSMCIMLSILCAMCSMLSLSNVSYNCTMCTMIITVFNNYSMCILCLVQYLKLNLHFVLKESFEKLWLDSSTGHEKHSGKIHSWQLIFNQIVVSFILQNFVPILLEI